jgi:hypothetical protein
MYGEGISKQEILDLAVEFEIIKKQGLGSVTIETKLGWARMRLSLNQRQSRTDDAVEVGKGK